MSSYIVKENHIGSAVSKILLDLQEILLLLYKDTISIHMTFCPSERLAEPILKTLDFLKLTYNLVYFDFFKYNVLADLFMQIHNDFFVWSTKTNVEPTLINIDTIFIWSNSWNQAVSPQPPPLIPTTIKVILKV